MILLRSDSIDKIVSENDNVLVVVTSPTCGNCIRMKELISTIEERNNHVVFIEYIGNDQFKRTNEIVGRIAYTPTILFFKNNKLKYRFVGGTIEEIEAIINR